MNRACIGIAFLAVAIVGVAASPVVAQIPPKPPTPLPWSTTEDDLPITDAVTLWIDGQDLTVYVDSTTWPENENKISHLEINWVGPGPGFVEENCDFANIFNGDFLDACTAEKIAKLKVRGFGPVYSLGNLIPEGYPTSWSPADAWTVTGTWGAIADCLDHYDPNSPYFGPVPEPSVVPLFVVGVLGTMGIRRRP